MNAIPYLMQGDNLVLLVDNDSYTIGKETHINYNRILDAIKSGNWSLVKDLVNITTSMTNYAKGKLLIEDGNISWNGRPFHNALSKRMLQMYEQGFDVEPLTNFMENIMENPSYRAVEELYGFMEKNDLPLTPDGSLLAYKRVRRLEEDNGSGLKAGDLVDCHSGQNRNNIDDVVTMPRNAVDDNASNTCSTGLHFCSLSYLSGSGFGGNKSPIMIVKINPKDVVSIPTDYNNQKGRCCAYTVVAYHGNDPKDEAFDEPVNAEYEDDLDTDVNDENDDNQDSVYQRTSN